MFNVKGGGYTIGVDIGGTFTDCVVLAESGEVSTGKVSTTPNDLSDGFFASIGRVASQLGLTESELITQSRRLVHGTTAGINALVTGRVAPTVLLTSKGHADAIRIMNNGGRGVGASLEELLDFSRSSKPDALLEPDRVIEITQRMDCDGDVVVDLSEREVLEAAAKISSLDIGAVAISFLWSIKNSSHEERVHQIIAERCPGVFVSCGHEVASRIGEYSRTVSTIINAQLGPLMSAYIDQIVKRAKENGFPGKVDFGHCVGGVIDTDTAKRLPILTLQSGPVGGVVGAAKAGRLFGINNTIVTDMGGTTFDVSLVSDGELQYTDETVLRRQIAYLRKVDVESVGAGGGSIAWIDDASGTLRVGPQSAGALPGPICYGRGGTEVTVTDADLVLGVLNPDRPLAGGLRLDKEGARKAIRSLGVRLGLDEMECASGIVEIVDSRMEDLIRSRTIQRGYDPRSFAVWALGGASGAHAGLFTRGLGVERVVFPLNDVAAVWSACGLALLDHQRVFSTSVYYKSPFAPEKIAEDLQTLEAGARRYAQTHGLPDAETQYVRSADIRYSLQVFEVDSPLPSGEVDEMYIQSALSAFEKLYEERYGPGTGYASAGFTITALRVTVEVPTMVATLRARAIGSEPLQSSPVSRRNVFWRELGTTVETDIYEGASLGTADEIFGPAVIEYPDTTIVVRPEQTLTKDDAGNLILQRKEEH
jgi:N-methylhydantoinase A